MDGYTKSFSNDKFLSLLVAIDEKAALSLQKTGKCEDCGNRLHFACYERTLRLPGIPFVSGVSNIGTFFGLCCSKSTCRRRTRAASVRFASRSPNFVGVVALIELLNAPGSMRRLQDAAKVLDLSVQTLKRWVLFWRASLNTSWWRKLIYRFPERGSPCDLVPSADDWRKLVFWLETVAELFLDMSKKMARDRHPQKMADAGKTTEE